jgi:hypothetical protein
MVAPHYRKKPPRIGKGALLYVFNPRPVYANGDLVLSLARDSTRMAADTLAVIDYETEVH